jgi:hypothetical protein
VESDEVSLDTALLDNEEAVGIPVEPLELHFTPSVLKLFPLPLVFAICLAIKPKTDATVD